jgi:L-threonylcarbamoyladenylate synthase
VPAAVGHFLSAESERPLTIIYENARNLAPGVAAQDNSVGIRVTKDAFCRAIVAAFGKPITSTSANISGLPFDGSFDSIASELLEAADHVAVWRRDDPIDSLPSRVLRVFPDGAVEVIRD